MAKPIWIFLTLSAALLACNSTPRIEVTQTPQNANNSVVVLSATVVGASQLVDWSLDNSPGQFNDPKINPTQYSVGGLNANTTIRFKVQSRDNPNLFATGQFEVKATPIANILATGLMLGGQRSYIVSKTGEVFAWGSDSDNALGDGTAEVDQSAPVRVVNASDAVAVHTGIAAASAFAIRGDGSVLAWGNNSSGQLGLSIKQPATATLVPDLQKISTIRVGTTHALALNDEGVVFAFGSNKFGQLGNGTTNNSSTPIKVALPGKAIQIAAGELHSLALLEDGSVMAWGRNNTGQLGVGDTEPSKLLPTKIALKPAKFVSAGSNHSLAILEDGRIFAWGNNSTGQLGDDSTIFKISPKEIEGLVKPVLVAGGASHSLALQADGTVLAWGDNRSGQLGVLPNESLLVVPNAVTLPNLEPDESIIDISAGFDHSMVLTSTGRLFAWGNNDKGQLGNGTTTSAPLPIEIDLP
jgi:alpha-tubulin suppressor-like RCC1 family protein